MKTFKTIYEFYDLPDDERMALIGTHFQEAPFARPQYDKKKLYQPPTIYFPIGLSDPWENYGVSPGLISVGEVNPIFQKEQFHHFLVQVASPDDLDMGLLFEEPKYNPVEIRKKTLEFLISEPYGPWTGTSYREFFELLQEHLETKERYF